jgi:hypothetical protein
MLKMFCLLNVRTSRGHKSDEEAAALPPRLPFITTFVCFPRPKLPGVFRPQQLSPLQVYALLDNSPREDVDLSSDVCIDILRLLGNDDLIGLKHRSTQTYD